MNAPTDTSTGRAFAERFGADQAEALAVAAMAHADDETHANHGSDPFRWVLSICIGWQCFEIERYREHHGITADCDEIKAWIKSDANLTEHDGDVDYLALFAGKYSDYLPAVTL